jgi:hypothetical protein
LSCADPIAAIKPSVKHPTANTANCFLISFPPQVVTTNIEPKLLVQRNSQFIIPSDG